MAVESGKDGKIMIGGSDIGDIKNWKFTRNANNKSYASSRTAGHTKVVKGVKSGTVSFELVLDPDDPIEDRINEGDDVTLLLYRDASRYWSVPVRIESMDDSVNIEEGDPPTVSVEAQTNGAWTSPAGDTST